MYLTCWVPVLSRPPARSRLAFARRNQRGPQDAADGPEQVGFDEYAAAGGSLDDAVKLTIFLTDLDNFATVNEVMAEFCSEPYPARAAVEVAALPKGVDIEADAIIAV